MYFTIKDLAYVRKDCVVSSYIQTLADTSISDKIVKGLANINKLSTDDKFTFVDSFKYSVKDSKMFIALENEHGVFITREDNVKAIESPKDVLESLGFTNLIKAGDRTILLSGKQRWMTTRLKEDADDVEKAVMILLLKAEGYSVQDIYKIAELVKEN